MSQPNISINLKCKYITIDFYEIKHSKLGMENHNNNNNKIKQ